MERAESIHPITAEYKYKVQTRFLMIVKGFYCQQSHGQSAYKDADIVYVSTNIEQYRSVWWTLPVLQSKIEATKNQVWVYYKGFL